MITSEDHGFSKERRPDESPYRAWISKSWLPDEIIKFVIQQGRPFHLY